MKTKKVRKVAILTAGGLAPCLSTAIAALVEESTKVDPTTPLLCYVSGNKGFSAMQSAIETANVAKKL